MPSTVGSKKLEKADRSKESRETVCWPIPPCSPRPCREISNEISWEESDEDHGIVRTRLWFIYDRADRSECEGHQQGLEQIKKIKE